MKTSDTIANISAALVKAIKNVDHAIKDRQNPHFRNDYATLASTIDATKSALLAEGVVVLQGPSDTTLTTRLQHSSGEFIETETKLINSKGDMQGLGSAITYARRYALAAIMNIAQEDDDGNAASTAGKAAKPSVKAAPKVPSKPSDEF